MKSVLIVDDHEVVRDGVKNILGEQVSQFNFGEASTAPEALRLIGEQRWDLVILDLSLAGRNGLELLKQLKEVHPKLPVLILSMHSEEQYARRAFKAGAAGYVTKESSRKQLGEAVNKVIHGGRYISAALAERVIVDMEPDTGRPLHATASEVSFWVNRSMEVSGFGRVLSGLFNSSLVSVKTSYRQ